MILYRFGHGRSDQTQFQRAVQVYLWARPAMQMVGMRDRQAHLFGGGNNVLAVWKNRQHAPGAIAANPAVVYGLAFLDLREGPLVFDLAPRTQGLLDDFWHRPLTLVGASGPDKGRGGKYLLLPPEYDGEVPAGYLVVRSPANNICAFLRGFLAGGKPAHVVSRIEQSRIYALAQRMKPPAMGFPNAWASSTFVFTGGYHYFESLAKFLDSEPASAVDEPLREMAANLGIAKGQPFDPDSRTVSILKAAADVAQGMAVVTSLEGRDEGRDPRQRMLSNGGEAIACWPIAC